MTDKHFGSKIFLSESTLWYTLLELGFELYYEGVNCDRGFFLLLSNHGNRLIAKQSKIHVSLFCSKGSQRCSCIEHQCDSLSFIPLPTLQLD